MNVLVFLGFVFLFGSTFILGLIIGIDIGLDECQKVMMGKFKKSKN